MSVEEECLGTGKRFPQFCTGIHQSLIWRRCQIRFGSHCTTEPAEGEKIWGCHYLVIEEKKAFFVIIRDKYLGCQWDGYPWTQSSAGPSLRPGERWFRPSSWTRQTEQRSPPPTKVYLVTWHELLSFDVESMLIKEKTRNKGKGNMLTVFRTPVKSKRHQNQAEAKESYKVTLQVIWLI